MCGIAGVIWKNGDTDAQVAETVLQNMGESLAHRGPDDSGSYRNGRVGFVHRRLSIIDTSSAGHQPMTSADGRYTLVFNGEIYNYAQLRDTYLPHRRLVSHSDTEVLLYLLAEHGIAALPLLRGMFAFAFWDEKKQELLLARDPFGKKPLYYLDRDGTFSFASELKALLSWPEFKCTLDMQAITQYLLYEHVPADKAGVQGVRVLPMGHYALMKGSKFDIRSWWQPSFQPKLSLSEDKALERLDELLGQAVERRLVADVPVGVFLSGGLDSTTIAWYMQQVDRRQFHSCAIAFEDASFDESGYARLAAKALGLEHHEATFSLADFHPTLQAVMDFLDIPLADASLLPTYLVSKLARSHMTVVLDGDGSDELFGGYGTFPAAQLAEALAYVPPGAWTLASKAAALLPVSHKYFSWDFKIKSFLRGLTYPLPQRNQIWLGSFSDQELRELLAPAHHQYITNVFQPIKQHEESFAQLSSFDTVSLLTATHYLQNGILVKLDRATMAVGLEARTPFLDVDVAEFVMKLPVRLKQNKCLLKRLMTGRIPQEIIDRPKKGFGIPLGIWLQGPLYEWARDTLRADRLAAHGLFQEQYIERLLREHRRGRADERKKLWTLLMFQLWYERWISPAANDKSTRMVNRSI